MGNFIRAMVEVRSGQAFTSVTPPPPDYWDDRRDEGPWSVSRFTYWGQDKRLFSELGAICDDGRGLPRDASADFLLLYSEWKDEHAALYPGWASLRELNEINWSGICGPCAWPNTEWAGLLRAMNEILCDDPDDARVVFFYEP